MNGWVRFYGESGDVVLRVSGQEREPSVTADDPVQRASADASPGVIDLGVVDPSGRPCAPA